MHIWHLLFLICLLPNAFQVCTPHEKCLFLFFFSKQLYEVIKNYLLLFYIYSMPSMKKKIDHKLLALLTYDFLSFWWWLYMLENLEVIFWEENWKYWWSYVKKNMTWKLYAIVSWGRSKFTEAKNDRKVEFCPESIEHRFEVSVCEGPDQIAPEPGYYKESRRNRCF